MIKKRNLDNSLIQWIMTVTGLGPGIGDVLYISPAASSSSKFTTQLTDNNISDGNIYATLATAEAAIDSYRNDIMLVMPGAYVTTATLAWDKPHTHMLGLGGPNIGGDYSEFGSVFYSATSDQANIINVTGQNCMFTNVTFNHVGSGATAYCAVLLDGYGCTFKGCQIAGQMGATAAATRVCASLYIDTAGMYPLFEDCQIGQDVWSERSGANGGVIRFNDTGRPNGGTFRRCRITSRADTQTVAMVDIPVNTSAGRGWLWDDCTFMNYNDDAYGSLLNQVFFTVTTSQKGTQLLHNCSKFGIQEWEAGDFGVVAVDHTP